MKTPMQQLIYYAFKKYGSDSDISNDLVHQAAILKEQEKQAIINAFKAGNRDAHCVNPIVKFEQYYNETYSE